MLLHCMLFTSRNVHSGDQALGMLADHTADG